MTIISKHEASFKRSLKMAIEIALPRFEVFPLADTSSGLPDWLIAGNGVMSMLEFKHATPTFKSRGIQVVTARRLARAGHCRYVVFWEHGEEKRTCIIHPQSVLPGYNSIVAAELTVIGHSNEFVISYVRKVHGL